MAATADGFTPLHLAAVSERTEEVQEFRAAQAGTAAATADGARLGTGPR